jgi:acetolactate synthase-1/2/3 large subunit
VPGRLPAPARPEPPDDAAIAEIAAALQSGQPACVFVGGRACRAELLAQASGIAAATGAKLLCETFPARLERGAGRAPVDRLAYLAELAAMQLEGLRHIVLVDAKAPVSFFAYPGKASDLVPQGCRVHVLAPPDGDLATALAMLAERVGSSTAPVQQAAAPGLPTGTLTADAVCAALGALMPEGAIVSDEGNTSGLSAAGYSAGSPPHDWLCLTGGAIGQGLPVAVGAAIACPDRKVIALESDGSALYTVQSWWTMARENLDVTTILFNNRSYAILNMELGRVGAGTGGPRAKDMLDLSRPDMDFTAMAKGLGVDATRATTADEFVDQLVRALGTPGPTVIEAMVPSIL